MFWKTKNLSSNEYETVLKRIADCKHEIEAVKAQLAALQTNYDNLRGQFNRKLSVIRKEEQANEEQKDLNNLNPFVMG